MNILHCLDNSNRLSEYHHLLYTIVIFYQGDDNATWGEVLSESGPKWNTID